MGHYDPKTNWKPLELRVKSHMLVFMGLPGCNMFTCAKFQYMIITKYCLSDIIDNFQRLQNIKKNLELSSLSLGNPSGTGLYVTNGGEV